MNHEDGGIMRELLTRWAGPSGILLTVGLGVWLIQLNASALRNAEEIGALKASQTLMKGQLWEVGLSLQRTAVLQESLYRQVDTLDDKVGNLEGRFYESQNNKREPSADR